MSELFKRVEEPEEEIIENEIVTDRFLTFLSDGLVFGINSINVIEILATFNIRSVPMVPSYVKGVINLRGQVLPIIDMRLRMKKEFIEYDNNTCVIVIEYEGSLVGLVVDTVIQVQTIDASKSSPIPVQNKQDITNSMIKLDDGTVVLLIDCPALINGV